jgi:hypothetical protein
MNSWPDIFRDVTLSSVVEMFRGFGGNLLVWFLDLLFCPEDGGSTFFRNVCKLTPETAVILIYIELKKSAKVVTFTSVRTILMN